MSPEAVGEILTIFEAAYRVRYEKKHAAAWVGLLEGVADWEGRRAAVELAKRRDRPPAVSDVLAAVLDIRAEAQRQNSLTRPALAAGEHVSLRPPQQFALMRQMWAMVTEMTAAGVSGEEKERILTSMATDAIRAAQESGR